MENMSGTNRLLKSLGIVGAVAVGGLVALGVGIVLFGHYMSLGSLASWPPGGDVDVMLSRSQEADVVMTKICQGNDPGTQNTAERYKQEYARLLVGGVLARVPDATPVVVIEQVGSASLNFSRFRFRSGPLKGRQAWACPNTVKLDHAFRSRDWRADRRAQAIDPFGSRITTESI
jgi:hypothetical protein